MDDPIDNKLPRNQTQTKPRLRSGLAIIPMPDAVQLRAGDEEIVLLGTEDPDQLMSLLQALDGSHTIDALVELTGLDDQTIEGVLEHLASNRLLAASEPETTNERDDSSGHASGLLRFLGHRVNDVDAVADMLSTKIIGVVGRSPTATLVCDILGQCSIRTQIFDSWPVEARTPRESGGLGGLICIWEQPDQSRILQINQSVCQSATPCLFVNLSHGQHATVGPFYIPGESACYQCLTTRLHENTNSYFELVAAESHMQQTGQALPEYGVPAHFRHWAAGVACGEVIAYLTRHRPLQTLNRAITIDFEKTDMWTEPVWQVPWCPHCTPGDPAPGDSALENADVKDSASGAST